MTTSGTVSQTAFDTGKIIETAFRRCKIPAEGISSEMAQTALDALYVLLSELPTRGFQLWATDTLVLPVIQGNAGTNLPEGTIDVIDVFLRQVTILSYTQLTDPSTSHLLYDLGDDNSFAVSTVGIVPPTTGPLQLSFYVSDDATTFRKVGQVQTQDYTAGDLYWGDIDAAIVARYFQIVDDGGNIISGSTVTLGTSPYEIPLTRINRNDYGNIPNKTYQGRPTEFWYDRQIEPVMRVWPTPAASYNSNYQYVVHRQRHIMDVGTMQQMIEVPQRWYDAIIWGLAHKLCFEIPQIDISMAAIIEPLATSAFQRVFSDERDASPIRIQPDFSAYTR